MMKKKPITVGATETAKSNAGRRGRKGTEAPGCSGSPSVLSPARDTNPGPVTRDTELHGAALAMIQASHGTGRWQRERLGRTGTRWVQLHAAGTAGSQGAGTRGRGTEQSLRAAIPLRKLQFFLPQVERGGGGRKIDLEEN